MAERPAPALAEMVARVHHQLVGHAPGALPRVSFYPYVDTKSTLRERDGRLVVRLSDHLEGAPDDVLEALVGMLICRYWRWSEDRVDPHLRQAYDDWMESGSATRKRSRSRQERGRKHLDPIGKHRSLLESYLRVTMEMDLLVPKAPRLGWSQRDSRRRFGHWDADHNAIIISQALDDRKVPEFVLDFVVYHEILHIIHPPRKGRGRRHHIHPPEFVAAERRFPKWKEAESWLTRLAR